MCGGRLNCDSYGTIPHLFLQPSTMSPSSRELHPHCRISCNQVKCHINSCTTIIYQSQVHNGLFLPSAANYQEVRYSSPPDPLSYLAELFRLVQEEKLFSKSVNTDFSLLVRSSSANTTAKQPFWEGTEQLRILISSDISA